MSRILIAINAPDLGPGFGRAEQTQRGLINNMLKLLGGRIELGQSDFASDQNGMTTRMRIEQSTPVAKTAGEQAA
jgi:hypothetical protein